MKEWAVNLKQEILGLYLVLRDPRTPLAARIIAGLVVMYAFSPIDLIPDFVPILGYLDELVLLPLGIALVIRLVPHDLMEECRRNAGEDPPEIKLNRWSGVIIVAALWCISLWCLYRLLK